MTFLHDLNPLSIMASVITVVICGCILFLDFRDWLNRWKSAGEFDGQKQCTYLCMISLACLVGAIDAFSPHANVPRKTVSGKYQVVHPASGKGGSTDLICVIDCTRTDGYTLALNDDAQMALRKGQAGGRYQFEYMTRPSGSAFTGVSLRVVGIRDADSGAKLYEVDLARHWGRVLLFTGDFLLFIGTGVLCVILERSEKNSSWDEDGEVPESEPKSRLITELDLSPGDSGHSSDG